MAGRQGAAGRRGVDTIDEPALRVGVRDFAQVLAVRAWAAAMRRPVVLYGQDAEALGALFWREVEERLAVAVVVDCGPRAGTVLAALRVGSKHLVHRVGGPQEAPLDALLRAHGAVRERALAHLVLDAGRPVGAQLARWRFGYDDLCPWSW